MPKYLVYLTDLEVMYDALDLTKHATLSCRFETQPSALCMMTTEGFTWKMICFNLSHCNT